MSSLTFTKELKEQYDRARKLNCKEAKEDLPDKYYCATSKSQPTARSLNLNSEYVFCDLDVVNSKNESKKNDIMEYRLQAYLIKEAMRNNFVMQFKTSTGTKLKYNWRLLDAERKFAEKNSRLDLLAYDEDRKYYVILELKVKRSISIALTELDGYYDLLKEDILDLNETYGINTASDIIGYVIMPKAVGNKTRTSHIVDKIKSSRQQWGIIEYEGDFSQDGFNETNIFFSEPDYK